MEHEPLSDTASEADEPVNSADEGPKSDENHKNHSGPGSEVVFIPYHPFTPDSLIEASRFQKILRPSLHRFQNEN